MIYHALYALAGLLLGSMFLIFNCRAQPKGRGSLHTYPDSLWARV